MIFIGISITAVGLIISFILSFINTDLMRNNFTDGDSWYDLKMKSNLLYINSMLFNILFSIIHTYIWYLIIQLLSKINLTNPFTLYVSRKLELIAYLLITLGILSIIGNKIFSELLHQYNLKFAFEFDGGYLFIAGIVFIISQIFKRGIEIQEENELTV